MRTRKELRTALPKYLRIKSSSAPSFSQDDRTVGYISDVTGVPQAWAKLFNGSGGKKRLTFGEDRVGFVSYARSRDLLAYGVDSGGDEHFQIRVRGAEGAVTKVTDDPGSINVWGDWSRDSTRIAFSTNARNSAYFDIHVHSLQSGKAEVLYQNDGNNYALAWSPSGTSILFTRLHSPFNHDLFIIDRETKKVTRLTPHENEATYLSPAFSPSADSILCVSDEGRDFSGVARVDLKLRKLSYLFTTGWDVEELSLTPDGRRLAFTVNEGGLSRLCVSDAACAEIEKPSIPPGVVCNLRWSNGSDVLAFTLAGSGLNPDVWAYKPSTGRLVRLVRSSLNGVPRSSFVIPRLRRFDSFDGLSIPGFVYLPRGKGPHPLIVYLHGGPESQFRPSFSPLIQFMVRTGFAVAAPNFRGSTGYGKKYTHLDDVRRRMDAVKDVHSFVEGLIESAPIDPRRIAAWGGSYGGFMVLACLYTRPEFWTAGVDIVGISNLVTFLKNTGAWRRRLRIAEYGDPDRDMEFLEDISPLGNAHLIRAPLFIIHGANDPRVPVGEAEQIANVMEDLGREVHLLKFDDEGHGLVKLRNRIKGYTEAVGFLLKHMSSRN